MGFYKSIKFTGDLAPASKSTSYTATVPDRYISYDTSGTPTLTLPSAALYKGTLKVMKATTDLAPLTISRAGSDTFLGGSTSTTINTQGECIELTPVSTVWHITQRRIPSTLVSLTPVFTGFGTVSSISMFTCREGQFLYGHGIFTAGTSTATEARMTFGYGGTESNVTANGSAFPATNILGEFTFNSASSASGYLIGTNAESYIKFAYNEGSGGTVAINGNAVAGAGTVVALKFKIPITGWNG